MAFHLQAPNHGIQPRHRATRNNLLAAEHRVSRLLKVSIGNNDVAAPDILACPLSVVATI
jgi:hypothetical protein